ncbi:MAG: hypothetical protein VYA67_21965 [Actinomycetota bacterium]|nr:hypothetical protein [Actinomycetota bacterium]
MTFGSQTVTFLPPNYTGTRNSLGIKTQGVPNGVPVEGCRHRPLTAAECDDDLTEVSEQVWKTTAPPHAAAIAAKNTGLLECDGVVYELIGDAKTFPDMSGEPFKVTILSSVKK